MTEGNIGPIGGGAAVLGALIGFAIGGIGGAILGAVVGFIVGAALLSALLWLRDDLPGVLSDLKVVWDEGIAPILFVIVVIVLVVGLWGVGK